MSQSISSINKAWGDNYTVLYHSDLPVSAIAVVHLLKQPYGQSHFHIPTYRMFAYYIVLSHMTVKRGGGLTMVQLLPKYVIFT